MATSSSTSSDQANERINQSNEDIVRQLAEAFSCYPIVNVDNQIKKLERIVEAMLMRLDEFSSLLDQVRQESDCISEDILPEMHKKCREIDLIFDKTEQLETFISVVKNSVDALEEHIEIAEKELDTNTFMRTLSDLFSRRKAALPAGHTIKHWHQPNLFKTSDYFPKEDETESSN